MSTELNLKNIKQTIPTNINRSKIIWTDEMIKIMKKEFPVNFNKEIAKKFGIGWRSVVRKARELGIKKEPLFLEKRRRTITQMAVEALPPNNNKGNKGWSVPNAHLNLFKKGNIPPNKRIPGLTELIHKKRNKTIRLEKLRLKYGLNQKTKLKLTNIY